MPHTKFMIRTFFYICMLCIPLFGQEKPLEIEKLAPNTEVPYLVEETKTVEAPTFYAEFLHMLWSLGLILGVFIAIAYVLKRIMHAKVEKANVTCGIKILERRALSQKTSLYVIQVGNVDALIADTHQGVTVIAKTEGSLDLQQAWEAET